MQVQDLIQNQQKVPRKFHSGIASNRWNLFLLWSYFPREKELVGGRDDTSSPPLSLPCQWRTSSFLTLPWSPSWPVSDGAESWESSPWAGAAKKDLQPLCVDTNNPFPQKTEYCFLNLHEVFLWQPWEEAWGSMPVVDLKPHKTWPTLFLLYEGI